MRCSRRAKDVPSLYLSRLLMGRALLQPHPCPCAHCSTAGWVEESLLLPWLLRGDHRKPIQTAERSRKRCFFQVWWHQLLLLPSAPPSLRSRVNSLTSSPCFAVLSWQPLRTARSTGEPPLPMWESSKMCKQALQQSPSGLMTCFPPLSGPPAPPLPQKNVCFPAALGRNAIRAPSAVVQRGGRRLGQAGIGRCAHLGHLAAGWGGSWQPPALPRANKQTETRHSQHGEGGRGVGKLKSCLLGSLGGKAAGGKQSKANWLGG